MFRGWPLGSSVLAGAAAGVGAVLADGSLLLRLSFLLFIYYVSLTPRVHYAYWTGNGRRGVYTILWGALAAVLFRTLPQIPFALSSYAVLVEHVGAGAYCLTEAVVLVRFIDEFSGYLHSELQKREMNCMQDDNMDSGVICMKILIIAVAFGAFAAGATLSIGYLTSTDTTTSLWASLPGIVSLISVVSCIVLSLVVESGIVSEAGLHSLLISYSLWSVRNNALLRAAKETSGSSIAGVLMPGWVGLPDFPFDQLVFIVIACIVLSAVITTGYDGHDAKSDAAHGDYLFEIEPFVKACLVILGTNAIGVYMGYFDSSTWVYFRVVEIIAIPLIYWHRLANKMDDWPW